MRTYTRYLIQYGRLWWRYLHHYLHKPHIYLIAIIVILSYLHMDQQQQIDTLRERLDAQTNMKDHDSFDYRITNLESIANAHGDRLKILEGDNWTLQETLNQYNWRLIQLEWTNPNVKVSPAYSPAPEKPSEAFNGNPGHVPDPVKPGESIYTYMEPYKGH